MPLVDVTDILFDADVAGQSFQVIRRQEIVNNFGESVVTTETIDVVGSIQPSGNQEVERGDAFDAQAKSIIVATTFRLRGVSKGPNGSRFKPDIIISDILGEPNMFEVTSITGWNAFGAGFIEANATTIAWVDFAPAPTAPELYIGRLDFSQPRNAWLIGVIGIRTC
jgi:hypothetical protein